MDIRLRKQSEDALGQVNQWYCSQAYGQCVVDPELLWTYFIKSGGAADFARRFEDAMGPVNRWYCSEFHGRDVREPEILWNYYVAFGESGPPGDDEFDIAC